jgi:glycosyltransferase involved in cell wall biosynthesis
MREVAIQWLGRRPAREVYSLIGEAIVLVFPSVWYEGFGRTIIEAFAKGTPVIASDLGAMAELVDHGRTGLRFRPGAADDLASKVEQLMGNSAELQRMRREARAEFETKYTAEQNYLMMQRIYEMAMSRQLPARRSIAPKITRRASRPEVRTRAERPRDA